MTELQKGIVGYERVTEAMIFGQHYKITENNKWIKTKMTRAQFLQHCFKSKEK